MPNVLPDRNPYERRIKKKNLSVFIFIKENLKDTRAQKNVVRHDHLQEIS